MERYKPIIEDWEEFKQACDRPIISTVRRNQIKAGSDFEERLRREFKDIEQSGWNDDVYRLKSTDSPGKSVLHWLGHYYVQEESAALPIEVLNPKKGDKVLDTCAAPGGKSTQIASKINNKGTVIANDDNTKRMKSLHANTYRTSSTSVLATNYDGRQIPGNEKFDKILVDAPCSGEGDKARRKFETANIDQVKGLARLQKQLIDRSSELLKEDGTLVYSTCTFAPEENEEVVKHALEETELEIKEINSEIPHSNGLTSFQDREYGEEMGKTVRVYPHHLDSGGIYVAKFTK